MSSAEWFFFIKLRGTLAKEIKISTYKLSEVEIISVVLSANGLMSKIVKDVLAKKKKKPLVHKPQITGLYQTPEAITFETMEIALL